MLKEYFKFGDNFLENVTSRKIINLTAHKHSRGPIMNPWKPFFSPLCLIHRAIASVRERKNQSDAACQVARD